MNTLSKIILASVVTLSTQAIADNKVFLPEVEPSPHSQETLLTGDAKQKGYVLSFVEPDVRSSEARLVESHYISSQKEVISLSVIEPSDNSSEAIL